MSSGENIWHDFGFSSNPYSTKELEANAEGDALLVGRDSEVKKLQRHWKSMSTLATVEGPAGVGKTSLVAVATYRAMQTSLAQRKDLVVPLNKVIQFDEDVDRIEQAAYLAIAQTLHAHATTLSNCGHMLPDISEIATWINSPVFRGKTATLSGFGGGYTSSPNTGEGFRSSGLKENIDYILNQTFPAGTGGAIIGIMDNLELLQTSQSARDCLETMRDTVFQIPGVKWVLVGANGIVRSSVSTPRLSGRVAQPIRLDPIPDGTIAELMRRRLDHYGINDSASPPIDENDFERLYQICGRNLRDAFSHAQNYSMWFVDEAPSDPDPLSAWIKSQIAEFRADFDAVTPEPWALYKRIIANGGAVKTSQLVEDGETYPQAIRYRVRILENAKLVETVGTPSDMRVKIVKLTPIGWFAKHVLFPTL